MIIHRVRLRTAYLLGSLVAIAAPALATVDGGGRDSHKRMLRMLQKVAAQTTEQNAYLGDKVAREMKQRLNALPPTAPPELRWQITFRLARETLRLGHEREALENFETCLELSASIQNSIPDARFMSLFHKGVALMRIAETENCCARNAPESCIFPIRGAAIHKDQEGARGAMQCFLELLQAMPEREGPLPTGALAARWLLNLAAMTLGEYPDGVPEKYLIPPDRFATDADFPRFHNVASSVGVDRMTHSGGAVADDFDNDGDIDLWTSTWHPEGQLRYYRNDLNGGLVDQTEAAGVSGIVGGLNMIHADYDNDGDLDLFVLRGAWLKDQGRHPNSLLQNQRDGTFKDVTFAAGLGKKHYPTQTAAFADYDNDGDLDLYVGNEASNLIRAPSQLFRNHGDGTFRDVASKAGVSNFQLAKAVVWGDFDRDRWPDLFVSNYTGPNRLYRNMGNGRFVDIARKAGVDQPKHSFPAWFFDYDNDGALDLFVASYAGGIAEVAAGYLGQDVAVERPRLYRGDGNGGFFDVAAELGLSRPSMPMGSNFGDLDNDGFLDFYLGTGWPNIEELMPNLLFWNQDGQRFVDVTTSAGVGHLQKGHAVVFADFDNDGDQDLFEQVGGAYLGDAFRDALFENPGFTNHYLNIRLEGTTSNRSAIGARLRVLVKEEEVPRTIYRDVNSGGSFGSNPLSQHIGLGNATEVALLEVYWPTSDLTQQFHNVPADQYLRITEGEEEYETLSPTRFVLARPK